jgi:uncharacterized membrane protein
MYQMLTFLHNITRWLVLLMLLLALITAIWGLVARRTFAKPANAIRRWTTTVAHLQLVLGMLLYFRSPAVQWYWSHPAIRAEHPELQFFSLIHPLSMLLSIVLLSIGSALARRREAPQSKYRTMLIWYGAALLIMLVVIPWPFSPLASRPYWR